MRAIFEIEWEDSLGQEWMTENSLNIHLKRYAKNPVVVHKLYDISNDMSNDIRRHIFKDGIKLVRTWATGSTEE